MSSNGSADGPLPVGLARQVDEACERFEVSWKAVANGAERRKSSPTWSDCRSRAANPCASLLGIELHYRRRAGKSSKQPTSRAFQSSTATG